MMNRLATRAALVSGLTASVLALSGVLAVSSTASPRSGPAVAAPHTAPVAAVPASAAPLSAAPVGALSPSNCTEDTVARTASCDLYAMAGSTQIVGHTVPIWGFSTTGLDNSATAPGPVLVVSQGDDVTITLRNSLAQAVSLALPGQVDVQHDGTSGDDLTGVATGQSSAYTFKASRPGTFLYSAGHTADGARQVSMGLAGALVVLPTTGGSAYGSAATTDTSYADESVVVLSEVDPRLNADPVNFDMREFHPAYRLINGKSYPGTDPISTATGNRVLLRYVNAGSQMHAMSLLGANQVEVGEDGHPAAYTTTVTAESILPGETLDAIVTMPSGTDSKVALFENSQHLDNAGATAPGGQQMPFGGMLTYLDTNAPAPSTDVVGPTAANISASPNPADGQSDVTVTADVSDARTGGSYVDHAELVVDDPTIAIGSGTPMTTAVPASGPQSADFSALHQVSVTGVQGVIPAFAPTLGNCAPDPANGNAVPLALECLAAGTHHVYVRAHDVAGNWGVIGSMVLNLPKTGPQTVGGSVPTPANGSKPLTLSATGDDTSASGVITDAEYFIDTPGDPNTRGIAMTLNRSAKVVSETATISAATVAGLSEGTHHLWVRSKDSLGLWGPTLDVPLNVDVTGPRTDAVSMTPMAVNGVVSDPSNPGYARINGSVTDVAANGSTQNLIVGGEAFFDRDPGLGKGLVLRAVDGKFDSSSELVYALVPQSQLKIMAQGPHQLFLRGKDNAGNWGSSNTVVAAIAIDRTAPVLSAFAVTPNPTNGAFTVVGTASYTEQYSSLDTAEYWFGATDPGVGKATVTTMDTTTSGKVSITVSTAGLASNSTPRLNMRVRDKAGNWSAAVNASFTVTRPNSIYANNFEPLSPAWPAVAPNTAAPATNAKVPTSFETTSTQGLSVTSAAAGNFLTDLSPFSEPTYHARFAFNPNTLTTGGGATASLTLLQARTGDGATAGAEAFALQYHRVGTGQAQVRIVADRSNGTAIAGAWVSLAAVPNPNQITVDWTATSLKLTVVTPTQTKTSSVTIPAGNTYKVETVNLGVISPDTGSSGTAFFDSFSSGRTTAA